MHFVLCATAGYFAHEHREPWCARGYFHISLMWEEIACPENAKDMIASDF
jgi:hypothetical protein